jgi:predicted acyl esterase
VELFDWNEGRADEPYVATGSGALRARWRNGSAAEPLQPGLVVTVSIALTAIAHEFRAGSTLSLSLAPGRCGLLENPQTGEPITAQTHRRAGTIRLWHDAAHPSRLVLPVLE